jgi:hypothetical protein
MSNNIFYNVPQYFPNEIISLNNKKNLLINGEKDFLNRVCKGKLGTPTNIEIFKNYRNDPTIKKYGMMSPNGKKLTAFIFIQEQKPAVYVAFLCSDTKGGGSTLLKYIKEKYRSKGGYNLIYLHSRKHAIKFYKKQGYKTASLMNLVSSYIPNSIYLNAPKMSITQF